MYRLYYLPGACSRAVHALLIHLNQPVEIVHRDQVPDFAERFRGGKVPVLIDGEHTLYEGASIILHLLEKHKNDMLPKNGMNRTEFIEWLLFANATIHPAYSRLFFISKVMEDGPQKENAFKVAVQLLEQHWSVVEKHLENREFIHGHHLSIIEILLAVYEGWGRYFPIEIGIGKRTQALLERAAAHPALKAAAEAETVAVG